MSALRQIFAAVLCLVTAAIGLAAWYSLKIAWLDSWSEMSFSFMALVIGIAVGVVGRICNREGSFGFASFAAFITLAAGMVGMTIQYKLEVESRLRQAVAATYEETMAYAKIAVPIPFSDDDQLRQAMDYTKTSLMGRLAAGPTTIPTLDYWTARNLIHLSWVMSRQIFAYGEMGRDKTLLEASRITDKDFTFVDDLVRKLTKEGISDDELIRFREMEHPHLRKLLSQEISRETFESSLKHLVRQRIDWLTLLSGSLGPLVAIFIPCGVFAAYRLVRRYTEAEEV